MEFYKILKQKSVKKESFCNMLDRQKTLYITGNYPNSFAIKYSPDTFNDLLNDSSIFREYNSKSIQQLFVTNQKFLAILKREDFFRMSIEKCLFVEDSHSIYLEEYDELSWETVEDVVDRYEFKIKEVSFVTKDSKRKIILQKSGVIGIDSGLTEPEKFRLLKLIDTLNFGLGVIDR